MKFFHKFYFQKAKQNACPENFSKVPSALPDLGGLDIGR